MEVGVKFLFARHINAFGPLTKRDETKHKTKQKITLKFVRQLTDLASCHFSIGMMMSSAP